MKKKNSIYIPSSIPYRSSIKLYTGQMGHMIIFSCLIFSSLALSITLARPIPETPHEQASAGEVLENSSSNPSIHEEVQNVQVTPAAAAEGGGTGKKEETKREFFHISKIGGHIILGGFTLAIFGVVGYYIGVTRRRRRAEKI